jgi:Type II secretion system (T2SS), protein F
VSLLSIYFTLQLVMRDLSFSGWFSYVLITALVGTPLLYGLFWGLLLLVANMMQFYRSKEIDDALPEYLELCALNVKAGMSIDRALWYSVRPKFGILAKEMEIIAKRTLTGDSLVVALKEMSQKFDSPMLKRTISLITEGVESGGELGALLHTISADLRETKILKQEMASSVTTYVIFITFASIMAAPALMGLSYHLLNIIQGFASRLDMGASSSFSISSDAITLEDYKIFAMLSLGITSFFSAAIISVIRYGNVKEGMKYIPIFIGWSILLFFLSIRILGVFLGGILDQ